MKTPSVLSKSFLLVLLITGFGLKIYSQKLTGYDKRLWRKNIILIEGIGASQGATVHYERIFQLGRGFSLRADVGVTPFLLDQNYNWYYDKCITPIVGGAFYAFPNAFKLGVGCSVLMDVFYDRIPETIIPNDTLHGGGGSTESYPRKQFRARVMPYIVAEGTINNRWIIRAGFSPIIDPANDAQEETYFIPWATFAVGFKFGK